jgi:hypothetical protein
MFVKITASSTRVSSLIPARACQASANKKSMRYLECLREGGERERNVVTSLSQQAAGERLFRIMKRTLIIPCKLIEPILLEKRGYSLGIGLFLKMKLGPHEENLWRILSAGNCRRIPVCYINHDIISHKSNIA